YDRTSHRFFAAASEVEGNLGVNLNCTPLSRLWFAVSKTSDPRGGWFVYFFYTDGVGDGRSLLFTELGFDNQAVYIGGNMYSNDASGNVFLDGEMFWFS